jgi:cell wall integrity and stress response component
MKSMLVVAALAALGGAMPNNIVSLRQWGTSRLMGRQEPVDPLAGEQEKSETPKFDVATTNGCYKSPGEMKKQPRVKHMSELECGEVICGAAGFLAASTMGGADCYCGNTYPPEEDLVDDEKCNIPCTGYGQNACGGIGYWTVYNTGVELLVEHAKPKPKTSTSTTSTTKPTSTETAPEKTHATTSQAASEGQEEGGDDGGDGGGTNVAGIVAGVVVGVVVIASALGGGFLYMRRKRNKEIEEEHRRNAAVNAFIGKPPGSSGGSLSDARMDPVMAHRRMSDGSIADNQDYSRKILRVTNA